MLGLLLTSITSEVINDQAHVTTQRILNKFIEVHKLFLACTFGCDAVYSKAMKLKLLIRFHFLKTEKSKGNSNTVFSEIDVTECH